MPKAKKPGKCVTCGGVINVGDEIRFDRVPVHHRHAGNGTVTKTSTRWVVHHADYASCMAEKDHQDAEYVNYCRERNSPPNLRFERLEELTEKGLI